MVTQRFPNALRPRIRLVFGDGLVLGPGRADLLEGIRDTGSIAAAGRRMGMSYKRAWQLAEALNTAFTGPTIQAAKGGVAGGGARLTALGEEMLAAYRAVEAATVAHAREPLGRIAAAMAEHGVSDEGRKR